MCSSVSGRECFSTSIEYSFIIEFVFLTRETASEWEREREGNRYMCFKWTHLFCVCFILAIAAGWPNRIYAFNFKFNDIFAQTIRMHLMEIIKCNFPLEIQLNKLIYSFVSKFSRLERSKVRVSFYQSGKPQLISPPEPYFFDFPDSAPFTTSDEANFSVDPDMATIHSTIPVNYNRQIRYVIVDGTVGSGRAIVENTIFHRKCWARSVQIR